MKRIASLTLLLALVAGTFVFADDATILPQGVFRVRAIPSYTMLNKSYDNSGKLVDATKGSLTVMSGAAELGIIDPITFGLQWAPGYYVASNFDLAAPMDKMVMSGPADLQVGAKIEVLGAKGFVQNDKIRVALTPGVQIPLDSYDAAKEAQNFFAGKNFRAASTSDYQSFGLGFKADGDYQINDMFFVNLHGELKYFLPNESVSFNTAATYYGTIATAEGLGMTAAQATAYADVNAPLVKTKTEYGIVSAIEFEPHAKYALSETTSINAGLPFTYDANAANKVAGTTVDTSAESLLSIGPNASLFTVIGPLPVEVEVQYVLPLMGKNSSATNTLSLQLKVFGKAF